MKRSIKSIINKKATIKAISKLHLNKLKGGSGDNGTADSIEDPVWIE